MNNEHECVHNQSSLKISLFYHVDEHEELYLKNVPDHHDRSEIRSGSQ